MIELHKIIIVYAICFVIFAGLSVNGQKDNKKSKTDEIPIQIQVTREGWTVPAFADDKTEVSPAKLRLIDGVEVQMNGNKLPEEKLILVELCKSADDVIIRQQSFYIRAYATYAVNGRVFAYRMPAAYVFIGKKYIERAAAVTFLTYVDEDGSGRFKLRCDTSTNEFEILPEWVGGSGKLPVVKQPKY